jgi:DNA-binding response OmpR family regulator
MPKRILIVDDEVHLAKIIEFTLKRAGYETIVAHDGRNGLEKALTLMPDLIILDYTLPVLDGGIVCAELRRCETTRSIPIMILTAHDISRTCADGSVDADEWMEKPFNTEALLERIRELLEESIREAE